jgi:hypothetical protein
MNKWEYCVIGPLSTSLRPIPPESFCEIWYLNDSGVQVPNQLNLSFFSQDNVQYSAQLIWLLGEEGWEMIGSGTGLVALSPGSGETGHMLYFKRRKNEVGH